MTTLEHGEEEDRNARLRLRRKMLERWENEGGKLADAVPPEPSNNSQRNRKGSARERTSTTK